MTTGKEYSLLLLAGGKSARMGSSKAELLYEGKTFLDHMLGFIRRNGGNIYHVGDVAIY